jgi:hypothetical protein
MEAKDGKVIRIGILERISCSNCPNIKSNRTVFVNLKRLQRNIDITMKKRRKELNEWLGDLVEV